ncbi:MAG: rRNA synthase [Variibacter sp.]|nr:rRNA synthase [Variibacter sp.]
MTTRKSNTDEQNPGERIAKVMARAGLCSRLQAEAWIEAGRVAVNGEVFGSQALNVAADDLVVVDGKPLPQRERTRLFLYHKPRGLVTTHADPQGRPTIFAALPKSLPRLLSVGRLDMNTEGLLLLTNDGGLARLLELPATGWMRRYRVRAHGRVTQERLDTLRRGISLDGIRYGPIDARLDREQGANIWVTFAMREGKNREVKNVLGHLGLAVNRLIRVSFGPFQLGDLAEGVIEEVRTRHLREQLGEKISAAAGLDFAAPMAAILPPQGEGASERSKGKRGGGGEERSSPPKTPARTHASRAAAPPQRGRDKKPRRSDAERFGEPALARREKRQRKWRPPAGKGGKD